MGLSRWRDADSLRDVMDGLTRNRFFQSSSIAGRLSEFVKKLQCTERLLSSMDCATLVHHSAGVPPHSDGTNSFPNAKVQKGDWK